MNKIFQYLQKKVKEDLENPLIWHYTLAIIVLVIVQEFFI